MGMVVRSNIMAINANRQLGMNNSKVGKSLEKLASGFRINRAGDDASGLAISEKMKAQIKGLETASSNAQDGVSLIQTAEGALTEVHDMLNRMVELVGKAANGTMDENVDRAALQKEVSALKDEINRIAEGTNFNGIKLLDGSLGGGVGTAPVSSITWAGSGVVKTVTPPAAAVWTSAEVTLDAATASSVEIAYVDANGEAKTKTVNFTGGANEAGSATNLLAALNADGDLNKLFTFGGDETGITFTAKTAGADKGAVTGLTSTGIFDSDGAGSETVPGSDEVVSYDLSGTLQTGDKLTIAGKVYEYKLNADGSDGKTFEDLDALVAAAAQNGVTVNAGADTAVTFSYTEGEAKGLTLQIGDTADPFNQVTVSVGNMNTIGLGIEELSVEDQATATAALDLLKNSAGGGAINIVSSARADLGALQNRLEHTINNLDVAVENMSAANSRIRDTDMAKEMMEYTKMNVLTQAAQAMLAQANQQPQSVLQLLQ